MAADVARLPQHGRVIGTVRFELEREIMLKIAGFDSRGGTGEGLVLRSSRVGGKKGGERKRDKGTIHDNSPGGRSRAR